MRASTATPILMVAVPDPVASGLVASLARPGANVTGLTANSPTLGGKQLEYLYELFPSTARVGLLWNEASPAHALMLVEAQTAAAKLGLELQALNVRGPDDLPEAFKTILSTACEGLLVFGGPINLRLRAPIVEFAAAHHLPAVYGLREFVQSGGLMSYGVSLPGLYRRTSYYVDRVLKGTKPADLPVQQPTQFDLVVNLKTAESFHLSPERIASLQLADVIP
jgi:putative ABC transport system substrate-binding protein